MAIGFTTKEKLMENSIKSRIKDDIDLVMGKALSEVFHNTDFTVEVEDDREDDLIGWLKCEGIVGDVELIGHNEYKVENLKHKFNREIVVNMHGLEKKVIETFERLYMTEGAIDDLLFVYIVNIIYYEIAHMEYFDSNVPINSDIVDGHLNLQTGKLSFYLKDANMFEFYKELLQRSVDKTFSLPRTISREDRGFKLICDYVAFNEMLGFHQNRDTKESKDAVEYITNKLKEIYCEYNLLRNYEMIFESTDK